MDAKLVEGLFQACLFDMCALESDPTAQNTLKCAAYEQLNTFCLNYARANKLNWLFPWRTPTACRTF